MNYATISDLRGIEQRYYCVRFVLPPLEGTPRTFIITYLEK